MTVTPHMQIKFVDNQQPRCTVLSNVHVHTHPSFPLSVSFVLLFLRTTTVTLFWMFKICKIPWSCEMLKLLSLMTLKPIYQQIHCL